MKKQRRITKNREYQNVFQQGVSTASRGLVLYQMANGLPLNRTGFVTSKKLGNAVVRNRARRLLREAYRIYAGDIKTGYDLVFIARPSAATFDFKQAAAEMKRLLQRGGLFSITSIPQVKK
ncbi:MAG: ribonuclease P protein component [Clostridiales bacterium]|nr:ribonuclease P protein component [Clostridiales bacterium]